MPSEKSASDLAHIFDIKRDCSEDGPGIRTTVFFKGCPLSCHWCQNPEGRNDEVKISFNQKLCHPEVCGVACVPVCEAHCLTFNEQLHVAFDQCTRCDKCFDVCPTKALEPVGYEINLQDLLYRVLIDEKLYQTSGGGVTLSGGEATQQMDFASQFLQELKKRKIHTALETSGFFNYRRFEQQMLPYLDLIYFDLKLMDDADSRQYTGQGSTLIQENFTKLIAKNKAKIVPRIPLIPGITATQENLSAIAEFLHSREVNQAVLLPYNPLWVDKIKRLGITPQYQNRHFMTQEQKQASTEFFKLSV